MGRFYPLLAIFLLILHGSSFAETMPRDLKRIRWMTEEYAPYNFTENGKLKGISVDILAQIWKRAGMTGESPEIEVLPWARGYMYVQNEKNTCLFFTAITEERKAKLIFADPIPGNSNVIIAKKSRKFKIDKLDDLKKLTIGVMREDFGEHVLLAAGWKEEQLEKSSSPESLVKKLHLNRMDAISYGNQTAYYYMRRYSIDPDQYETIFLINTTDHSFAFNKLTDPELIKEFRRILGEMIKDGTVEKIRKEYLN